MDSLQHQIALTLVPQIGAVTAKTLVSYCGSAEAVFRASKRELHKIPGIGPAIIAVLTAAKEPLIKAEREIGFMEQHGVQAIFYTDPAYPARLRQCQDSPAMFFFKGSSLSLFDMPRVVAIIGTRQPSDHGKAICEEIVEGFQAYNVLIVSGLAFGVDVTAHRKAPFAWGWKRRVVADSTSDFCEARRCGRMIPLRGTITSVPTMAD